jgi:glycosyltransferase involved in cell wall biosynthesis
MNKKSMHKKKLVVLLASYIGQRTGGAELQASYLCECGIKTFDMHYVFVSNGQSYTKPEKLSTHAISVSRINHRFSNLKYLYILKIWKVLKSIRPEFIYQRCGSALTGIAAIYARLNNCQLVYHIAHDRDVHVKPLSMFIRRPWLIPEYKLMQYGIKHANTIIAQTQFQAEQLLKEYKRTALIIPNGHPVPDDCVKTDNPVTIVWIANWKPFKQPEIFVKLAEKIGNNENVRFVMLGRSDEYDELAEKAKNNNIQVMGEVSNEEVNDFLSQSHILINTSQQEGFSNTFIQAWMRRVPVISLQVNPDNVFQNEQLGYCSGNFTQLVEDTKKLIDNHELRTRMGLMAREHAIKHHSLQNMNKILDLINQ